MEWYYALLVALVVVLLVWWFFMRESFEPAKYGVKDLGISHTDELKGKIDQIKALDGK